MGSNIEHQSFDQALSLGNLSKDVENIHVTYHSQEVVGTLPNMITWDDDDDLSNPKNWPERAKWGVALITSSFTLLTLTSSTMLAPALSSIAEDLNITNDVETQVTLSVFVLAFAIGPLFLGPLSEVYGRAIVLQLSSIWFCIWNLVCGFSTNKVQMIVARLLAGIGGSACLSISGGVLSDCWKPEERGSSIALNSFLPLLGPAIGPITGGYIAERASWRWSFWATSLACATIVILSFFFLRESHEPTILLRKAKELRKKKCNNDLRTRYEEPDKTTSAILITSLTRPLRMLCTQPAIQIMALYSAYNFGNLYVTLSTFSELFINQYHQSIQASGLNYISIVIGYTIAAQIGGPVNDKIYRHLTKARTPTPEFRAPLMLPGSILIPVGLLWYGWSAQAGVHWIMPNIGCAIFGIGNILTVQCLQAYIIDAYTEYAASAVAAVMLLRSIAGFAFPMFAPQMYDKLGYGWGNSVLAFIAIGIGIPAPILLWTYGARLRARATSKVDGNF